MSYAFKILTDGLLSNVADTVLYAASNGVTGKLYLRNTDGSACTVYVGSKRSGGTVRYFVSVSLAASGGLLEVGNIALANGEALIAYAGTNNVVIATFFGVDSGASTSAVNLPWTEVTGTSASMAVNNRYCANNAALVTLTLPATAAIGDVIQVRGKGAGGWKIAQNASQYIRIDLLTVTTTGVGGYIASVDPPECVNLVCVTADVGWLLEYPTKSSLEVV